MSRRRTARGARATAIALAALLVLLALSLLVGSRALDPSVVLAALSGDAGAEAEAIVVGQRLPRTIVGALGGGALGIAGLLIQGHTRNPLADPGLLGVTSGAALAVVVAISAFGLTTPAGYLWFAVAGAAGATALVTVIGTATGRRRDASPAALVLAGAAVSALLSAVTGVILLLDSSTLDVYRFWTVGSLAGGRDGDVVLAVLPLLVAGAAIAVTQARALDALSLGDDVARALGRSLLPTRLQGLAAVALLAAGATALVGSLGFVGLAAPHIARGLSRRAPHAVLVPLSALVGACLVLAADVLGRVVVSPAELPVGVVLGVIGGPAFLVLVVALFRRRPS
ncbi:FecCD family ABC transporter permease [Mycetocola reblochoni]|uniref:ABC-type Fe3+-siderophore transport system, permease component n=2 Tax=Mycetocola reblochoni TaxID=331618 RepID=A0A1R4JIS5_9MICO|nr:iron ABC transporter permease [Mycetocola reblochoni]RLP70514.1 iron ABC transporter permease [Mycetocola reblochoni]SJN31685.1 ABC-type Fe3+-siderophore transport system, permease component [Mycetocola reblochoni REB411]